MDDKLFIRGENGELYEGPLGENADNIKLLFVMKEPNAKKLDEFWMKDKVVSQKEGARYYNVLGAFVKSIIKDTTHQSALKQSAFINLYPFDGNPMAVSNPETGKSYVDLINDINEWENATELDKADAISKGCTKNQILCNRLKIIKDALENGISVVAHFEIVEMLKNHSILSKYFEETLDYPENIYHIESYSYKDKKAKLYSMPHPAYSIKYSILETLLNTSIYPEE